MRAKWLLLLMSLIALGCGPEISEKELGNVVYRVPEVPGAENPYPLPELKVTTSESESGDDHAH